jgi:hypothetical protein
MITGKQVDELRFEKAKHDHNIMKTRKINKFYLQKTQKSCNKTKLVKIFIIVMDIETE